VYRAVRPSSLETNIVVPQPPFERLALAKYDDDPMTPEQGSKPAVGA
jgi:hypothetical protein